MARQVSYFYQGTKKTIAFSFSQHFDIYEAVAAAEGVDLTSFWAMEKQLEMTSRGQGIMKNYRANEFERMGFSEIRFIKDEEQEK
ncbi:DUF2960 domain-containing protein [Psychromonas sp. 14N.309.X.WAT.B.A12]|uniref:DUF2960 domain-containing protein n=1 Tax=unclassified Psychromonas TaxID=2614957 RepID=UPI0025B15151|nr:DUF2960 domain-containing protein [Psychromonas sp. 14N.309.X.WAT.B.A12]MDN2662050.1 DUF2960 domain-containing protein [Psychromonas sp. 14N.309.X.WAT.B.A12]